MTVSPVARLPRRLGQPRRPGSRGVLLVRGQPRWPAVAARGRSRLRERCVRAVGDGEEQRGDERRRELTRGEEKCEARKCEVRGGER